MQANEALAGKLDRIAWVITAVVLLLVGAMRQIKLDAGIDFRFLPAVYSALNALTALILIYGYVAIRQKKIRQHQWAMTTAMISSMLFLLGYVLYHITTPETPYGGQGVMRYIYFFLLITHVVLAAVIFPFVLFTFIRGYTRLIERHRRLARWVYPLWLYVALTGPVLYFMIRPYYT